MGRCAELGSLQGVQCGHAGLCASETQPTMLITGTAMPFVRLFSLADAETYL